MFWRAAEKTSILYTSFIIAGQKVGRRFCLTYSETVLSKLNSERKTKKRKGMVTKMKSVKRFLCLTLCLILMTVMFIPSMATQDDKEVIVGGCLFGVKLYTDGVPVVGLEGFETQNGRVSPAKEAGIKIKDVIKEINGKAVTNSKSVTEAVGACDGKIIDIKVVRDGVEKNIGVEPKKANDGIYKIGVWLRDSAAGIGTVTYVDAQTLEFAGLGHGICDSQSLALMPMLRGVVSDVELSGIVKGQAGVPGEIKGTFHGGKTGALVSNKQSGVYGIFTKLPSSIGEKMQIAEASEISEGDAIIRCAVSGQVCDYTVKISKLNTKSDNGKNFVIEVTDSALLNITGGIVQGMSGSPVIQNGKLIGAVTHVMINSPTTGYGIFIENMMDA